MDICAMCHEGPGDARVRSKGFIETVVNEKKRVKKGKKDKNAPVTLVRTSFHYHLKCYPYAKIKFKGAGHPCQVTGNPILEVKKLNFEMEVVQTWEAPPEALKPEKEKKKENKNSDSKADPKSDSKSGAKSPKKSSDFKQTVQEPAPTKSPDKNNNSIDSKQNGAGDAVEQMMKEMEIMDSTSPTLSKSQKKRLKKKGAKQEEAPESPEVPEVVEVFEAVEKKSNTEEPESLEQLEIEELEEVDKLAPEATQGATPGATPKTTLETEDVKFQDLTFQLGDAEMQRLDKDNLYAAKFNAISKKACELYYTAFKFPELEEFFNVLIFPEHENLKVFNRSPSKRFSKPREIHLPSRELQNQTPGPPGLTGSGPPGLPAQPLTPKSLSELQKFGKHRKNKF